MEKVSVSIHQREILLMPFPYSDLSGAKVRPVLVISNDHFNISSQDVLVCGITSNLIKDHYTVMLKKESLEEGKLFDDCCIKVENIAKIDTTKVIKKIGKVNQKTFSEVVGTIHKIIG